MTPEKLIVIGAKLYGALSELREAEKAFDDARFAMNHFRMQRKRKGKDALYDAIWEADKKLDAARDAADELLAAIDGGVFKG